MNREKGEESENTINSSTVPEKTASELEAVYNKNHNPNTLLLIIGKYKEEEKPDYEKIINYYEKYFETANKSEIAMIKRDYVEILYLAGQKEKYYEVTNALLNDKSYMSEGAFSGISPERPMQNTISLMNPIVNSATSNIDDYNYAISKLIAFDVTDAEYLKEFDQTFVLYSFLCKLYTKINDSTMSNFYKNKIISKWDKSNGIESDMNEFKNKMIEDLNQFILS
jgi:hypothetical protein